MPEPTDTDPEKRSRKDQLLEEIIEIEEDLEIDRVTYSEKKDRLSKVDEVKKDLQRVYDEIKARYDEAVDEFNLIKYSLEDITRFGRQKRQTLDELRRELSRILDVEKINEAYLQQVEAFRQRCLDAPWRKENREDGKGALTHQIEGAINLAVAGQGLLGDKRGLGKSLTSLIWCDFREAKKVIVVCPSDTMDNFIREIKLWTPHRNPIKIGKMNKGTRDFLLPSLKQVPEFTLVLNYEAWRKDNHLISDLIDLKADTLILDEAHKAKTLDSHTCKGIMNLRFGFNECPECQHPRVVISKSDRNIARCKCGYEAILTEFCSIKNILTMTGTPILNRPQELYPQLRLINPEVFKSQNDYLKDFCVRSTVKSENGQLKPGHWKWRYNAEQQLVKKIGHRYVARDRKAAGVIIPPPTPVDHYISMDELEERYPRQYRAYMQAREYGQIVLDPDQNIAMSMPVFITVLLRLRQVLVWPASIILKRTNPDTLIEEVIARLNVDESAKIDKAEEIIREVVDEGERVVLFSQFTSGLHVLKARLGTRAVIYDGSTSDYMKNQIALDFDPKTVSDNPRWDVALCNYKSAGEGLNFQTASQMIFLDREWNPGKEEQAAGRIDRMGQTRETMIHRIHIEESVDTWMHNLIEEKLAMIGGFETHANLFRSAYQALRDGEI